MTMMKAMWKSITRSLGDNTSNPDEDQDQDDLPAAMEGSAEVWTDGDDIEDRDDRDDDIESNLDDGDAEDDEEMM